MSYRVDTQWCLWHTWTHKKQVLIFLVPPTAKGFIRITSIQPAEQAAGSQNSAGTPPFFW
jgi:hypothetical protein